MRANGSSRAVTQVQGLDGTGSCIVPDAKKRDSFYAMQNITTLRNEASSFESTADIIIQSEWQSILGLYLRAVANHFFFGLRRLRPKLGECLRSGLVPRPPFGVETASSTVHCEELDARNSRCLNLCTGTPVSLASSVIVNLRPR